MNKDMVNRRNSRDWIKINDNSKSNIWRDKFIQEHGGKFVQTGKYWEWQTIHNDEQISSPDSRYEFKDSDGIIYLVDNFSKFCRTNELNKAAMYGVINGTRNHHKGFTCRKL